MPAPQCLRKLSGMTPEEVMQQYGFPYLRNAQALQSRAKGELLLACWTETL